MEGNIMKKFFQYILMTVALVATASCSNELDEVLQPAGNGTLQFVVSDFPAFGESPDTRAIGTQDVGKTAWEEGDKLLLSISFESGKKQGYTLEYLSGVWTLNDKVLASSDITGVLALYAPDCEIKSDGSIGLASGKLYGMAEYIPAKTTVDGLNVSISFKDVTRTYSRLRIAADAGQELTVTTTGFTPAGAAEVTTEPYTLTANANGNAFLYGTFAVGGLVTVKDGDTELATHTFNVATKAGYSYALYAGKKVDVDLSTLTATYVINDNAYYTFTGTGNYGIKVESGNPTIVLNNASITVGKGSSAIDVASGSNATIFVMGDNTVDTDSECGRAGGIFVAEGGTVNITSNSNANILRAHGSHASAIGGKYDYDNNESYNAGNINISNVTVYAYTNNFYASAIGAAGEGTCGTINITNAVIYAYGAGDKWTSAPGIGSAMGLMGYSEMIPVVIISDSEVHTFRHNSASDYIGYLGDVEYPSNATGSINCGEGGSIANSTIYCYTGLDATTTDKVVTYDADGKPTED